MSERDIVILGRVGGVFGTRGWLKILSYSRPRDGILNYRQWRLARDGEWHTRAVVASRRQGNGLIAALEGIDDRDEAMSWIDCDIGVERAELPPPAPGEYYWADLIGLGVVNREGVLLGTVAHLLDTGANDVLVVRGDRERLIPFVPGPYIVHVDLGGRRIVVDWHADD